jgi:hypothetical protein
MQLCFLQLKVCSGGIFVLVIRAKDRNIELSLDQPPDLSAIQLPDD